MVGRGWAHWWVAAGLAHYLLILPAIAATELTITEPVPAPVQVSRILTLSTHLTRSPQNLLLTSLGGVLYIISGSATLTFYIPLVSTDQYPRHTGLALGGLTIMAGVALIRRSLHLILIIYFPTSQSMTWWGCGPGAGTRWRTPSPSAPASPSTARAGARRGQQSGGTFITITPPVYTTWGRPSHTASNQTNNNNTECYSSAFRI